VDAAALDAEIAFALGERRAAAAWTGADAVRRLARSSAAYAGDPAALALPPDERLRGGAELLDPLASQLRALAALTDARYVVVPVALRAAGEGDARRAVLRVLLADVRGARVLWAGETAGVPLAGPPAAIAARVAEQFADLVAAPLQP
jgi:hypothetical protein